MEWVNLFEWVQGVRPEQLPAAPFTLHSPQERVTDGAKWLNALQADARTRSRCVYGALQADLRWLYKQVEGEN